MLPNYIIVPNWSPSDGLKWQIKTDIGLLDPVCWLSGKLHSFDGYQLICVVISDIKLTLKGLSFSIPNLDANIPIRFVKYDYNEGSWRYMNGSDSDPANGIFITNNGEIVEPYLLTH